MEKFWIFLDKLRKKPEQEKSTIAFSVAVGITLIITITWLSAFFSSFPSEGDAIKERQTASPFDAISEQWQTIRVGLGEMGNIFKNEIEIEK